MEFDDFGSPWFRKDTRLKLNLDSPPKTNETLSRTLMRNDAWSRHPLPMLERFSLDSFYYDLLRKRKFVVGKAGSKADVKIDDFTVSSHHAELYCIKKNDDGRVKLFLCVIDKSSKFGTYVENKSLDDKGGDNNYYERIPSERPILLSYGDTIRFGLNLSGCYNFVSRDFLMCKDDLNEPDQIILEEAIRNHDGMYFSNNPKKITHYVKSDSILKESMIGLITGTPVVTVHYFIDLCKALTPYTLMELPFTENYIPKLKKSVLSLSSKPVSLDINLARKDLFLGFMFVCFTTNQWNNVEEMISAAGGVVYYYEECKVPDVMSDTKYLLLKPDICLNELDDNCSMTRIYDLFVGQTQALKRRPIAEREIELAIIFVNTTIYCNPLSKAPLIDPQPQFNKIHPSCNCGFCSQN